MERITNIYKKLVFAIVFISGMFLTSCTDYLTIIPPSMVVHEDFWHTEAEVNGMKATAYLTLCNGTCLRNAIVWGETRAETVDYPTASNDDGIKNLTEGLLYDDNGYASWSEYYKAINYCNLVMEFGPTVLEHDPNFTESEMDVVRGEMLALRAYAHFVLLRAFCNIPLATQVVINDAEIPDYPQAHPMDALKSIYDDLETASHLVLRSSVNNAENLGIITTNAVYSLMADVNMWQAAFTKYYTDPETSDGSFTPEKTADEYYDLAIENCTKVLDAMDATYKEFNTDRFEKPTAYNLLVNDGLKTAREAGFCSVYDEIFGEKMNSRESIFEFQIDDKNYGKGGNGISSAFGAGGNSGGLYVVQESFLKDYFEDDDLRKYSFTTQSVSNTGSADKITDIYVAKYTIKNTPTTAGAAPTYRSSSEYDAHWIMYRKTEIMLTKAEALVSREFPSSEDIKTAFDMTVAINKRWRMDTTNITNPLDFETYSAATKCLELVRKERARELCFEGRRWYDIVRMALQNEIDEAHKSFANKRFMDNGDINDDEMKRRLFHISAYFMPISKDEIRYNPLLVQNKSCRTSDDDNSITQN